MGGRVAWETEETEESVESALELEGDVAADSVTSDAVTSDAMSSDAVASDPLVLAAGDDNLLIKSKLAITLLLRTIVGGGPTSARNCASR